MRVECPGLGSGWLWDHPTQSSWGRGQSLRAPQQGGHPRLSASVTCSALPGTHLCEPGHDLRSPQMSSCVTHLPSESEKGVNPVSSCCLEEVALAASRVSLSHLYGLALTSYSSTAELFHKHQSITGNFHSDRYLFYSSWLPAGTSHPACPQGSSWACSRILLPIPLPGAVMAWAMLGRRISPSPAPAPTALALLPALSHHLDHCVFVPLVPGVCSATASSVPQLTARAAGLTVGGYSLYKHTHTSMGKEGQTA